MAKSFKRYHKECEEEPYRIMTRARCQEPGIWIARDGLERKGLMVENIANACGVFQAAYAHW
jgi:hypothetical protein